MKKTLLTAAMTILSYCSYAQYLPLTAGSGNPLTGDLHIDGTNGNRLIFSYGGVSNNKVLLGSTYSIFGAGSKDDFATYVRDSNPYSIWTNNLQRLIVDGNGNVGIGTTSPGLPLEVQAIHGAGIKNVAGFFNVDGNNGSGATLFIGGSATLGQGNARITGTSFAGNDYRSQLQLQTTTTAGVWNTGLYMNETGYVGIGTTSPQVRLDVNGAQRLNGNLTFSADQTPYFISGPANGGAIRIRSNASTVTDRDVQFGNIDNNGVWSSYMIVANNGNVGIGTTDPGTYKLAVNGTIHSKAVIIDLIGWPDYVFKKDYQLMPLSSVKSYIDQNHHLPEMPTDKEVESKGLDVGEMNKLLTKKVEELTLYLIEKDKEIKELKISQDENIKKMEQRLSALEKQ